MRRPEDGDGAGFAQYVAQKKRDNGEGDDGDGPGEKSPEKFRAGEAFFVENPGDFQQQEKCGGQGDRQSASRGPADGPAPEKIEIDSFGFRRIGNVGVGEGLERTERVVAVMLESGGVGGFLNFEGGGGEESRGEGGGGGA